MPPTVPPPPSTIAPLSPVVASELYHELTQADRRAEQLIYALNEFRHTEWSMPVFILLILILTWRVLKLFSKFKCVSTSKVFFKIRLSCVNFLSLFSVTCDLLLPLPM